MKKTAIVTATLMAVALSAPAFAAKKADANACAALQKQFESAAPKHEKAKYYKAAEKWAHEGMESCKAGKYQKGVNELHRAMRDLRAK